MNVTRVNINQRVRVKLTDAGRAVHRADWEKLRPFLPARLQQSYEPKLEDAEGWSTWQLWRLMQLFGPYISLGMRPLFEGDIEVIHEGT